MHIAFVEEKSGRLSAPVPERNRQLPSLAETLNDCGHLFDSFRQYLTKTGHVGIVTVHLPHVELLAEPLTISVAIFMRLIGNKLAGRIEGGYRGSDSDFYMLLVSDDYYSETLFQRDIQIIRKELAGYLTLPNSHRGTASNKEALSIDGVFLRGVHGETADNVLFRAFQQLFSSFPAAEKRNDPYRHEIEEIIRHERIIPLFQPIVQLSDGMVFGHEALSRIDGNTTVESTEKLFTLAANLGMTHHLDMLCRKKALMRAKELMIPGRIFLNVCPHVLQTSDHVPGITATLLDELDFERSRIIFELTERALITNYDIFLRALSHYREQGYAIAIDDLGSGYAGLEMLAKIEPEFVKLSRFFIAGIDTSSTRQALVEALVSFCDKIGAIVIAEGIERPEEKEFLQGIGVPLGQGFLMGRPESFIHV